MFWIKIYVFYIYNPNEFIKNNLIGNSYKWQSEYLTDNLFQTLIFKFSILLEY